MLFIALRTEGKVASRACKLHQVMRYEERLITIGTWAYLQDFVAFWHSHIEQFEPLISFKSLLAYMSLDKIIWYRFNTTLLGTNHFVILYLTIVNILFECVLATLLTKPMITLKRGHFRYFNWAVAYRAVVGGIKVKVFGEILQPFFRRIFTCYRGIFNFRRYLRLAFLAINSIKLLRNLFLLHSFQLGDHVLF